MTDRSAPRGDVLFVLDPLASLNPRADSSYVMITEALARGYRVYFSELDGLLLRHNEVFAHAQRIAVEGASEGAPLARVSDPEVRAAASFAAVVMRKDPPVDQDFIIATWWLDRAREQTVVINEPAGLRDLSEKLAILAFPGLIPRTFLLRRTGDLRAALRELGGQMILKPVYGYGGRGVLIAREDDPNLSTLFELCTSDGGGWTIAQEFVPAAKLGDKRILLVDGEAIGAVLRVPAAGELRNNFHMGGTPALADLSARDREICAEVGPFLKARGQFFVGLDVLGDKLTEINVTSPTGMQEVNRLAQLRGAETMQARFWDALERKIGG